MYVQRTSALIMAALVTNICIPWSAQAESLDVDEDDVLLTALGSVVCITPMDCSKKCFAEKKWCVEYAGHPYKPDVPPGALFDCIDSFPSARSGGSYTCLYRYSNSDVCVYSYGAKFGPIHPPAPPPLCIYKSSK